MKRNILALDLASQTGWAMGSPGDKPTTGSLDTRKGKSGDDPAGRFLTFSIWLNEMLVASPVDAVYYEGFIDPRQIGQKTNMQTAFLLIGLAAHCEMVCRSRKILKVERVDLSTIRTHFLGKGYDRKADPKALIMRQCRILGWDFHDNNAADAAALFSYAAALANPRLALDVTPLFGPGPSAREAAERAFKPGASVPSPGLVRSRMKAQEAAEAASGPKSWAEKYGHRFSSEIEE